MNENNKKDDRMAPKEREPNSINKEGCNKDAVTVIIIGYPWGVMYQSVAYCEFLQVWQRTPRVIIPILSDPLRVRLGINSPAYKLSTFFNLNSLFTDVPQQSLRFVIDRSANYRDIFLCRIALES